MPDAFCKTRPGSGALALCLLLGAILPGAAPACAQDPGQPATNLSLTSVLDGVPPGVGTYW